VPTSPVRTAIEASRVVRHTLADLGVQVSTGPVVEFRMKEHLRGMPGPDCLPLLYPGHFSSQGMRWPIEGLKKPNAILRSPATERWFYPRGFYCVVRRFSSKEERRRILAAVVEPELLGDAPLVGFENHLNVFHEHRHGLPEPLARGLALFLDSTAVDEHFRRFNGHTQVNATDLRQMKYPSREVLSQLGHWVAAQGPLTQEQIDAKLDALIL
jgi:adenine-specific DNA-methyltransferase